MMEDKRQLNYALNVQLLLFSYWISYFIEFVQIDSLQSNLSLATIEISLNF